MLYGDYIRHCLTQEASGFSSFSGHIVRRDSLGIGGQQSIASSVLHRMPNQVVTNSHKLIVRLRVPLHFQGRLEVLSEEEAVALGWQAVLDLTRSPLAASPLDKAAC